MESRSSLCRWSQQEGEVTPGLFSPPRYGGFMEQMAPRFQPGTKGHLIHAVSVCLISLISFKSIFHYIKYRKRKRKKKPKTGNTCWTGTPPEWPPLVFQVLVRSTSVKNVSFSSVNQHLNYYCSGEEEAKRG